MDREPFSHLPTCRDITQAKHFLKNVININNLFLGLHFYSATDRSKRFIMLVTFTHSHTHSYADGGGCHARCQLQATRGNLGFSILLKDTSTCSWGEPGFEPVTFRLLYDPLDLLSYSCLFFGFCLFIFFTSELTVVLDSILLFFNLIINQNEQCIAPGMITIHHVIVILKQLYDTNMIIIKERNNRCRHFQSQLTFKYIKCNISASKCLKTSSSLLKCVICWVVYFLIPNVQTQRNPRVQCISFGHLSLQLPGQSQRLRRDV